MTAAGHPGFGDRALQLHFMVYAARSGSTLLASELSRASGQLLVMPECRLAELLLARSDDAVRALRPDQLRRILSVDHQLRGSLGFTDGELDDLAGEEAGNTAHGILAAVARRYGTRVGSAATAALVKCGGVGAFPTRALVAVPEARMIHVVRDGRAVVNSLLTTERAFFPGEDMGRGDVVHATRCWTRQLDAIGRVRPDLRDRVLEVRYEDLLDARHEVVERILRHLDVPADPTDAPSFAVAEQERVLHRLVGGAIDERRRRAWRAELSRRDVTVVEALAGRHLVAHGYDLARPRPGTPARLGATIGAHAHHTVATLRWLLRRAWQFRARPEAIAEHGRVLLRRYDQRLRARGQR